jgi:hypothetical protein
VESGFTHLLVLLATCDSCYLAVMLMRRSLEVIVHFPSEVSTLQLIRKLDFKPDFIADAEQL